MALKNQLNFASGELDPVLYDRVTLQRFQNALANARNVMIGKTGSITSRFSRLNFKAIAHNGPVKIFCPPSEELIVEVGVRDSDNKFYAIIYDLDGNVLANAEEAVAGDTGITVATIDNIQFLVSEQWLYFFLGSKNNSDSLYKTSLRAPYTAIIREDFDIPAAPIFNAFTSTGTGYATDYAVTSVVNGEESDFVIVDQATSRPISSGEEVTISMEVALTTAELNGLTNLRFYRRPKSGASFGFIGSTNKVTGTSGGGFPIYTFTDIGGDADFSNGLPSLVTKEGLSAVDEVRQMSYGTGVVYQGRLILGNVVNNRGEAVLASRPTHRQNFYRDVPYDSDSALLTNLGTEGEGIILRMIDNNGLIVFTTKGVFAHQGLLGPSNLLFQKRGNWVIDERVPPLSIPGALLFVDKSTGSVRQIVYSNELGTYDSINLSIFSDHLLKGRRITSWSYQEGDIPLLLVTLDDGTFLSFTYSFEHQMRAWTRHDSQLKVNQVASSSLPETSFFLVEKEDGSKYIEKTVPRTLSSLILEANPDADKFEYAALMDSMTVTQYLINDAFQFIPATANLTLDPVTPGDWSGQLTMSSTDPIFSTSNVPGWGFPTNGSDYIYRVFNQVDNSFIDLEFISRTDDMTIVVQPSEEYPSDRATVETGLRPFIIRDTIDGLTHLEGEFVSIVVDGAVVSSPNNDSESDSVLKLQVTGGQVVIPAEFAGAITLVGRPITADIKTLNISTVEQSPTMIESITVNKLYMRVFETLGLFIDNIFPEEKVGQKDGNSVDKMQNFSQYFEQSGVPITANRAKQPISRRGEITLGGSWDTQGEISIRQVDPLHFDILSIVADVEVERRR